MRPARLMLFCGTRYATMLFGPSTPFTKISAVFCVEVLHFRQACNTDLWAYVCGIGMGMNV